MTAPAAPAPRSALSITLADLLVVVGGIVLFLFSFAPIVSVSALGYHENSWHQGFTVFIVLAALVMIVTAAIDVLWPRTKEFFGLRRQHVQLFLAFYVLVQMIAAAFSTRGASFGWGGYFMLLGALVAAAGSVLNHMEWAQNTIGLPTGSSAPAYPATFAPPAQPVAPDDNTVIAPTDPTAGS